MIDSYKILKNACQLKRLNAMQIHDTFRIFLLRKNLNNSLREQISISSLSIIIDH
jgi:hypothetical protein